VGKSKSEKMKSQKLAKCFLVIALALGAITKSTAGGVIVSLQASSSLLNFDGGLNATATTYDFWNPDTGMATSAKTLDTTTPASIANPELLYSSLQRNINAIIDFNGYQLSGTSLQPGDILSSELRVAVPEDTTLAQWQQINRAVQYGTDNGINVIVTPVR
jgi:hypothetical protein